MPKIYTYFGFVFFFYSDDHAPVHVHVAHDGKETVFELVVRNKELAEIKTRDKGNPLSPKEERTARSFVEKYWRGILNKWVNFFVYGAVVRCSDIKTKLK